MTDNNYCKIVVLETSDVHGNILPINYSNNERVEFGLAKAAAIIKEIRRNFENVLVVDNGDLIQGTPLTYFVSKINTSINNPMIEVLNYLNYDCAVMGNHEFNYGLDVLNKAVKQSKFPWISANIVDKITGEPVFGKPYIVKKFSNGLKVGVLGLTTKYVPNWENPTNIQGIDFKDPVECGKKWVHILKEKEKVDLVVVSYHGGFERDIDTGVPAESLTGENQGYEICTEIEGIDVLLTGHQHRSISNKMINNVLIIQPESSAKVLGKAEIVLRKNQNGWSIISKKAGLISTKDVKEDRNIVELVSTAEHDTQIWLDKAIGKINGDMMITNPIDIRLKDNPLIEFINKVQMDASGADISNTALFDNDAPGFSKDVTMRDIVSNYIYPNTLKVIRIKGEDIKAALEKSATYFKSGDNGEIKVNPDFSNPKPQHYNYDMWEGIEYIIDVSKPVGQRVIKLNYKGKPLRMNKEYEVVMNNYRAGGGGDYLMFRGKDVVKDIPIDVSELIANYILNRKVIEATVNNNWKIIR